MTGTIAAGSGEVRNVVLIMADQLGAHVRDRERHGHFATPNLDRLAAVSTEFSRAYCAFPLCVPSRSAMITGRYPHQVGVTGNAASGPDCGQDPAGLGHYLRGHGVRTVHAGKWHARRPSADARDGFDQVRDFGDVGLAPWAADWLAGHDSDRPFCLVVSFDDPHTICEWARSQPLPYGDVPAVPRDAAPPLPDNFAVAPYAPSCLAEERAHFSSTYATAGWTPDRWRAYRHAYATLVERADRRIGEVLDALAHSRHADTTAVIVTSDHGDGDAAHGWSQKTALYEECTRVPLLAHQPGQARAIVDTPVNVGLGLLPTLCRLLALPVPDPCVGTDFLVRSTDVVVETEFERAGPHTLGRALYRGRWKYAVYSWGDHREQLHDLARDPGELRNLAVESAYAERLEELRAALLAWTLRHHDSRFAKRLVLPGGVDPAVRQRIFAVPY